MNSIQLVDEDQKFWVDSLFKAVEEEKPDAVLIAGDVYDRKDPSTEAMKLFDEMITGLVARKTNVYITSGNHDSAVRLAHMGPLLENSNVYIARELESAVLPKYILEGDCKVNITLMPYVYPRMIEDTRVLNRNDLDTYDSAIRALLNEQKINTDEINILVAHQNVLAGDKKPEHSKSETLIGTVGEVDASAFDDFDYVALGHIHNEQAVGRETIRYSGCPLYYDFSEEGRRKGITVIDIKSKTDISVRLLEIPILHGIICKRGSVEELLSIGRNMSDEEKKNNYIKVTMVQNSIPSGTADKLREIFGENLAHIERERENVGGDSENIVERRNLEKLNINDQFWRFFMEQNETNISEDQEKVIDKLIEMQERSEHSLLNKKNRAVSEKDMAAIIDLLDTLIASDES